MPAEIICIIDDACDVEVTSGQNMSRTYTIRVNGLSKWAENFKTPQDALTALIAAREAGYKVPQHITKSIAEKIVQSTFNSGRL